MVIRLLVAILAVSNVIQSLEPAAVLGRYVKAVGGESGLRRIKSRITEGQFDNGRGLKTRFRIIEEAPNKRVVLIGPAAIDSEMGSGRGFDGTSGWDKNFIGTGLRTLTSGELADVARDADLLRALHLFDDCSASSAHSSASEVVVACELERGGRGRFFFDGRDGLLIKQEREESDGRPTVTTLFDDYKETDGVRVPFRTRFVVPGATITYNVETVRHNSPVDPRVFQKPAR
jgi:hypothetical protein